MDFTQPNIPAVGAVITGRSPVTCLSYHSSGQRLFCATSDNRLQVIDCLNGKLEQPALRNQGVRIVEATHDEHSVLCASGNAIQYWSIYDNKILRKFRGHSGEVTSLHMCPADDTFLSASRDHSVRLWNVRDAGCVAQLALPNDESTAKQSPLARFDSTGLVFAVSTRMESSTGGGHYMHLYDARNYSAGAFANLKITQLTLEQAIHSHVSVDPNTANHYSYADWTSLDFNTSGNQILVGTGAGYCILLDGFDGTIQRVLLNSRQRTDNAAVCCYTRDDRTVLQGYEDGTIDCWSVDSGTVMKNLSCGHSGPIRCIATNPKYTQLVSCDDSNNTALWCF